MTEVEKSIKQKMSETIVGLETELGGVRTGKANPGILDRVRIDLYGTMSPLSHAATISCPDAKTITISPFDKSLIKTIEKAIVNSDLSLNPSSDGNLIRLNIPALTEERRKDMVKQVKKIGEKFKISIRNHRREANDSYKEQEKKKEISKDELKKNTDSIQKLTDSFIDQISQRVVGKEKELLG